MLRTIMILTVLLVAPMSLMGSSCQGGPVVEYDAGKEEAGLPEEAGQCQTAADCVNPDPNLFCLAECKDTICVNYLCAPRPPKFDASR